MNVQDLTIDERLALLGIVAHVAAADGVINSSERAELKALAEELGLDELKSQIRGALERFPTRQDLLNYVGVIDREEAKELIRTIAMDLAQADGDRSEEETGLISDVIAVWARDED